MRRSTRTAGGFLILFTFFVLWGTAAMNYGDDVAVGKYVYNNGREHSTLALNPDHTFRQTLRVENAERNSQGTWRREGQGGVSFSKEFLVVSGDEPEPDGTTFSDMHKTLGLFVSLRLRQYHVLWYGRADSGNSVPGTYKCDEPGNAALGTYTCDEPEVAEILTLYPDHSFEQTVSHSGIENYAKGTWSQDSDGTVVFCTNFLKTSGHPLEADETASSMGPRGSSFQLDISKAGHAIEPVFHKRFGFQ